MPILRRHCRAAAIGLAEARLVWMAAASAAPTEQASQDPEVANALTSSQEMEIRAQYVGEVAGYLAEQRNGEDEEVFADRVASSLALREVLQDLGTWKEYYEERMGRLEKEEKKLRVIVPEGQEDDFPVFTGLPNDHLDIPDALLDAGLNGLFSTANFDDPAFAHLARARAIREFLELEYTRVKNGPTLKAKWDAEYRAWMLRIKEVERHAKAVLELRIVHWERALLTGLTNNPSAAQEASIRTVTFDPKDWLVQTAANATKPPNGVGEDPIALGLDRSNNTLTGFETARERLAENDKQMEAADKQVKEAMKAWKEARKAHERAQKATEAATKAWVAAGRPGSGGLFDDKEAAITDETAAKAAMNNAAKVAEQALAVHATVDAIREVTSGGIGAGLVGDGGLRTRLLRTEFNLGKSSDATGTLRTIANRGDIKGFVFGSTEGLYERAALEVDEIVNKRFPNLEQRTREFLIFAALQTKSGDTNSQTLKDIIKAITEKEILTIQKILQTNEYPSVPAIAGLPLEIVQKTFEAFREMEGAQHSHLDKAWNSFETEHQVDLGLSLHNLRAALAAGKINTVDFARPTGQEEPPITAKTGAEWKTAWENIIVFSGADDAQKETAKDAFFAEDAADLRYEFLSLVTAKRTYEILGQDQSLQSAEHKDLSQWVEKGADAYMDMLTGSPVEMGLAVVMAFFAIRGLFGGGGKIGSAVKWAVLGLGAAKLYENTTGENIFEQTGLAGGAEKLKSATTMAVTLNKADRAIANGYQPGELEKGYLDTATNRYAIADAMANDTLGDLVDWEKTHSMAGTQTAADMAKNMPDGLKDLSQPAEDHTRAIMGLGFLRVVYATTAGEENRYNIDKGRELFQRRAQQIAEASTSNGYADWKDVPLKEVLRSQHTLQDYQNSIDENRGVLDYSAGVIDWAQGFLETTGDTIFKEKIGVMTWLNNMRQTYGQAMIDNMKQWTVAGMDGAKDAWRFIKLKHEGMEVTIHQGAELAKFAITAPFYMGVEGTKWVIDATHENAPAVLAKLRAEWERNLLPEVEGLWNVTTNAFDLEGVDTAGNLFERATDTAGRKDELLKLFGIDANGEVVSNDSEGNRKLRIAIMHTYDFIDTAQLVKFLEKVALDTNIEKMIKEVNKGKTQADQIDDATKLTTDDIIKTLLRGGLLGTMASIMRGLQGATNASGEYIIKGVNLLFDDINETAMHIDAATGTWMDKSSFSTDILEADNAAGNYGNIITLGDFFAKHYADIQARADDNGEAVDTVHDWLRDKVREVLGNNEQLTEAQLIALVNNRP